MHQKAGGSIPGKSIYLGCGFDPWSGHIWEATNQYFSLTSMCLPLSLKSVNIFKKILKNS